MSAYCGVQAANPNAIIVSRRQQGNPILGHIRNVRWQYGDVLPDYQMGTTTCALFLSLRCRPYARPRSMQAAALGKTAADFRTVPCHIPDAYCRGIVSSTSATWSPWKLSTAQRLSGMSIDDCSCLNFSCRTDVHYTAVRQIWGSH